MSANSLLTSSTEGASALQVPQPGAQNHNTTGLSASAFDNTNDPPPTTGDVKSSIAAFSADAIELVDCDASESEEVDEIVVASLPQALIATNKATTLTDRQSFISTA